MSILRPMMRPIMRPMIRSVFRGSAFDPLFLFASGEQGAWYDPSDLTTLYQDSAGTTPVAADGDPVGLMLDKSQGLVLGPELVTNGDFSDGLTGWVATDCSIVTENGKLKISNLTSTVGFVRLNISGLAAGEFARIKYTASIQNGTAIRLGLSGGAYNNPADNVTTSADTDRSLIAKMGGTPTSVEVIVYGDASTVAYIDNISVRELPGNHATQSVSASRRLYKTNGSESWLLDDLVDDGINAQLPDLGTNATLAYADGSGVTILTGQTISGSTPLPTVAETYGAIYLDRPLTAGETESVTAYLNGLRGA